MWEAYFPKAEIVGIENLPDIVEEEFDRAQVIIGDATDAKLLKEVANKFKGAKIDIIIDDASHVLEQQIASFEALFPHLEEGGLYFVEDVCCSRFKDGNRGTVPFVDFLDYAWSITQQTTFFPNDDLESYHTIKDIRYLDDDKKPRLTFSPWNEQLEAVYFFHDLCVFEKKTRAGLAEGMSGRKQCVRWRDLHTKSTNCAHKKTDPSNLVWNCLPKTTIQSWWNVAVMPRMKLRALLQRSPPKTAQRRRI